MKVSRSLLRYLFMMSFYVKIINPVVPNATFLYPLKPSENLRVFGCLAIEINSRKTKWLLICS